MCPYLGIHTKFGRKFFGGLNQKSELQVKYEMRQSTPIFNFAMISNFVDFWQFFILSIHISTNITL